MSFETMMLFYISVVVSSNEMDMWISGKAQVFSIEMVLKATGLNSIIKRKRDVWHSNGTPQKLKEKEKKRKWGT